MKRSRLMITGGMLLALFGLPFARAQVDTPDFAAIDSYIAVQMEALRIPGLALGIVQDDETVYLMGYGQADPAGQPVTPQTSFRLASVSKTITAIAIMQLVEAGRLELDAPVQRYLPWFRLADEEASARISVRHLLYHTSGVPPTTGYDNFFNGDLSDDALERNVRQLAGIAPNRPVGSSYQYANLSYDILGLLVQTVSGQSYEAYIQEQIFTPLAMQHSFTSQAEAQKMATGYRKWFGFPFAVALPDDRANRPSSFLIASAEDLSHLLIAQLNDGRFGEVALLSPEGMAETQRPAVPIGETGLESGMGLDIAAVNGVVMAAKTGGTANYYARLVLMPDSGWGIIVLANAFDIGLGEQFDAIANKISAWLVNEQPLEPGQAPIGGGSAPIKFTLAVIVIVEIFLALRTKILLPPGPPDRRWLLRQIVQPLAQDLLVVLVVLAVVPRLINMSLSFLYYFTPDIFWLMLALIAIPLAKDLLKALLTCYRLQARRSETLPHFQSA